VFKRLLLVLLLAPFIALLLMWVLEDIPPREIPDAIRVATGIGAKLACSGHYLSGFDEAQNADDLASYSVLMRLLLLHPVAPQGMSASLLGGFSRIARYRPGLGCTLEYDAVDPSDRDKKDPLDAVLVKPSAVSSSELWPKGRQAGPADEGMQELLANLLEEDNDAGYQTRALLVVQDGRILGEAYADGIDEKTPLLGWSMGKTVTGIMLGRLQEMGKLSVSERNLFPDWSGDGRNAIALENMLQMSSGLLFTEHYAPGSDSTRMLFLSPSASDAAMTSLLEYMPGSFFSYSSGTTNLLTRLVYERVGGTPQAQMDFFAHEIAEPMALEATTIEPDASGVYVGSAFTYAPARDWARFGYLLVNHGEINGRRLLTPEWMARVSEPNHSSNDRRYGYQVWLNEGGKHLRWPSLPPRSYAMEGNRSQVVMMMPEVNAVIVRLGWSADEYPVDEKFGKIVAQLRR
jgi:CubicO group peptidase (beta-lactamase class C family)